LLTKIRQLGLGQFAHFRIVAIDHLLRFGDLACDLLEFAVFLREFGERSMLARHRRDARWISQHLGVHEVFFQLLVTSQFLFQ